MEQWLKIADDFNARTKFPNCVCAIDGKHIRTIKPYHSGSYYYIYKGFHSLVLLAIVNSSYELILVNFGINGRVADGGAIENKQFHGKLKSNDINLPDSCEVGGNDSIKLPFVFVGDEAFALRLDFLKPFAQKDLTFPRKVFNYRLFRVRNTPESSFEWREIAKEFEARWNFPHCCGALDGKHVLLQAPLKSGSEYFNYKSSFSVVLMALCDANYCITYVNIGSPGRMSDGGIFQNCKLSEYMENGNINFPPDNVLSSTQKKQPHVINCSRQCISFKKQFNGTFSRLT
nr:unnamed protein product [Callosobruchus analis]